MPFLCLTTRASLVGKQNTVLGSVPWLVWLRQAGGSCSDFLCFNILENSSPEMSRCCTARLNSICVWYHKPLLWSWYSILHCKCGKAFWKLWVWQDLVNLIHGVISFLFCIGIAHCTGVSVTAFDTFGSHQAAGHLQSLGSSSAGRTPPGLQWPCDAG